MKTKIMWIKQRVKVKYKTDKALKEAKEYINEGLITPSVGHWSAKGFEVNEFGKAKVIS